MDEKKRDAAVEAEQDAERAGYAAAGETWADTEATGANATEPEEEENDLILRFKRPYAFEGQEYTELDLSGLEDVSAATLASVGRAVAKKAPGLNPASVEMTLDYAKLLAQRVTTKPMEFFDRMPAKEAIKLKGIVVGFLFGGDGDN